MTTVLKHLENKLQPTYIGWKDQYKAILYALDIDPEMDIQAYFKRKYPSGEIVERLEY